MCLAVSNRIRKLKQLGILEGTCYKLNAEKIGQDYVVISTVTCSSQGSEQEKIANTIAKFDGVMSVYMLFGTSDILLIARRKDKSSAKQLVYNVSRIPGVGSTTTMVPHTVIKESLAVDPFQR